MLHITIQNMKLSRNIAIQFGIFREYFVSDMSIPCEMLRTRNSKR